jgi:hypothetical protein
MSIIHIFIEIGVFVVLGFILIDFIIMSKIKSVRTTLSICEYCYRDLFDNFHKYSLNGSPFITTDILYEYITDIKISNPALYEQIKNGCSKCNLSKYGFKVETKIIEDNPIYHTLELENYNTLNKYGKLINTYLVTDIRIESKTALVTNSKFLKFWLKYVSSVDNSIWIQTYFVGKLHKSLLKDVYAAFDDVYTVS